MDYFGQSVEAVALGNPVPENGYQGEYIKDLAAQVVALNAVVSANEGLGLAAIAVLKKNKLNGKVCVSGQDATVDGLRAILTGDMSNTVYKAIKAEAEGAATLAIALLRGEEATTATGSVNNGSVDVPSVLLVPVGITKANVKDVIADGFQTREAVCAGIEELCTANGI